MPLFRRKEKEKTHEPTAMPSPPEQVSSWLEGVGDAEYYARLDNAAQRRKVSTLYHENIPAIHQVLSEVAVYLRNRYFIFERGNVAAIPPKIGKKLIGTRVECDSVSYGYDGKKISRAHILIVSPSGTKDRDPAIIVRSNSVPGPQKIEIDGPKGFTIPYSEYRISYEDFSRDSVRSACHQILEDWARIKSPDR